jgi:hypothetical protein
MTWTTLTQDCLPQNSEQMMTLAQASIGIGTTTARLVGPFLPMTAILAMCPGHGKEQVASMTEDDLGPREAEAVSKLLDLAKFAILAMLVATGAMGANALI